MKPTEIHNIMSKLTKAKYVINKDGSVDVYGDVKIPNEMTEIPIQFGMVSGNFNCSAIEITSIKGAPREVGGVFSCSYTNITSLEGAPREVGGNFWCGDTEITSLDGLGNVDGNVYSDIKK